MLGNHRFGEVVELFLDQVRGLVDGGSDLFIIETTQDILELKAAVHAILRVREETGVHIPIQAQVTLDTAGRMLLGTDIAAALAILEVASGRRRRSQLLDRAGAHARAGPLSRRALDAAGLDHPQRRICRSTSTVWPSIPSNRTRWRAICARWSSSSGSASSAAAAARRPSTWRRWSSEIGRRPSSARPAKPLPLIASMIRAVDLQQEPAPMIVGERVNTLGSRKVKRLALADDYDGMLVVAREQMESGAHALDVCVAMTERTDEREMLRTLVKKLALNVEAPLVIDSTEADVLKDALEQYPGRAIVNSINMENGRAQIDSVMPLAIAHGAAVVALTIDEEGMAKTGERKLEAARKIHDIVVGEYGLAPEALIFDPLTFPLSTGDEEFTRSAIETIEGIRAIEAEMPGVLTILGVSNVSFGLNPAARKIVNAVFLYHAVEAGLDLAIVHPSHVDAVRRDPAGRARAGRGPGLARRDDALPRLIEHFEGREEETTAGGPDPMADMTPEERLHYRIVHRKKEGIEEQIDQAVSRRDPVEVLNNVLLPAMKEVGDKFGAGELILPFVLQSAEAMKKAVARLETYLERQEGVTKGTVVLATVYGDVHDIGKNLVNTILTNNGYTVHDLGKQVPVNRIIDKAVEVDATAIGLSALLVSTSKQMPLCVKELHQAGYRYPVIIGGAAINRGYAQRTLFVDEETPYEPGVFYAKDAFEGLSLMDRLVDPDSAAIWSGRRPKRRARRWATRTDGVQRPRRGARHAAARPCATSSRSRRPSGGRARWTASS